MCCFGHDDNEVGNLQITGIFIDPWWMRKSRHFTKASYCSYICVSENAFCLTAASSVSSFSCPHCMFINLDKFPHPTHSIILKRCFCKAVCVILHSCENYNTNKFCLINRLNIINTNQDLECVSKTNIIIKSCECLKVFGLERQVQLLSQAGY